MKTFKVDGYTYVKDLLGIVHQLDPEPFEYGESYISCYDSPEYQKNNTRLQEIRWDIVNRYTFGGKILDYGAGRGEFGKHAPKGVEVDNFDVDSPELPWVHDYGVITMWDVLEHIPDLDKFFEDIWSDFIVVSLPRMPDETLKGWKHLKPNEHLHHFNGCSLNALFEQFSYRNVYMDFPEDEIRKPETDQPNILTAVYQWQS